MAGKPTKERYYKCPDPEHAEIIHLMPGGGAVFCSKCGANARRVTFSGKPHANSLRGERRRAREAAERASKKQIVWPSTGPGVV